MSRRESKTPSSRARSDRGFSLVEILVATSLLVIGMSGILALFTAALALEAEAEQRTDVALALPEALRRVDAALFAGGSSGATQGGRVGGAGRTAGEFDLVSAGGAYRCRYEVEGTSGDDASRAVFVRVRIVVGAGTADEKEYDFGRIPTAPQAPPPGSGDGAQR